MTKIKPISVKFLREIRSQVERVAKLLGYSMSKVAVEVDGNKAHFTIRRKQVVDIILFSIRRRKICLRTKSMNSGNVLNCSESFRLVLD